MKIGFFCTSGYTEIAGLKEFLHKINPDVKWERCFPPKLKLKPGVDPEKLQPTGITGEDLLSEMRRFLRFGCDYDGLLLIDDADCRFHGQSAEQVEQEIANLQREVNKIIGREVPLFCLFASPEIEAWFVADWNNGLGRQFKEIERCLNKRIKQILGDEYWEYPEGYGGGRKGESCKDKISEQIQDAVAFCGGKFSKRTDGGEMLLRIDPERVAVKCNHFFAPIYKKLRELH